MEVQRLDVVTQQGDWLYRTRRGCCKKATNHPIPLKTLIAVWVGFVLQKMAATGVAPAAFTHSGARERSALMFVYTVGACFWFAILGGLARGPFRVWRGGHDATSMLCARRCDS